MLTKLTIRNFKRFEGVEIELGERVVFIGPNNSGKTTALQALALWELGLRRWVDQRGLTGDASQRRPGVTIGRADLLTNPTPTLDLLWRNLRTRQHDRESGARQTQNIRIDIVVEGQTDAQTWRCGLEFDYANPESMFCRPIRTSNGSGSDRLPIPPAARSVRVNYLAPMSGLIDREFVKQAGEIRFLIGQGRTAEVLRNLCWELYRSKDTAPANTFGWSDVCASMLDLFGVTLEAPDYRPDRDEIVMRYRERSGTRLDLTSAGRGLQQTLLLLAYLGANPGAVLLIDEPDAHLEILRQRQTYQHLTAVAERTGSQLIAASHSEVVLNEAGQRDILVAFVGLPHRIDEKGKPHVHRALRDIGFEDYYLAEAKGWVLYLEGSTDLAMLQAFAERLDHPARHALARPFARWVANQPNKAEAHIFALRGAKPDLVGFALYDNLDRMIATGAPLVQRAWRRYEIENYVCQRETVLAWAEFAQSRHQPGPLFAAEWRAEMDATIAELENALQVIGRPSMWSPLAKASTDVLEPLFQRFANRVGIYNDMSKSTFARLASFVPANLIDPEIIEVLDAVHAVATQANGLEPPDV